MSEQKVSRISSKICVYQHRDNGKTTGLEVPFGDKTVDVQSYDREFEVGVESQPVDLGWVAPGRLVVIVNEEGKEHQFNLTPKQEKELGHRVIYCGPKGASTAFIVRPGAATPFFLNDGTELFWSAAEPNVKARVFAIK